MTARFSWADPDRRAVPGPLRDPFVLRSSGTYYLTATPAPYWAGPVPGIPLWSSPDLRQWRPERLITERVHIPADACYRDRLWAPEIHEIDGGFYLTFNARNDATGHRHSVAVAQTDTVTGPYRVLTHERPAVTDDLDLPEIDFTTLAEAA
ncbi:family 43 glycosylhydrolase [Nonomuraea sp. NPDC005650]|uniref:family 43 glycosylhydrolase n=1 Tax=Nonomuraea sp. NPDC005650 TaxID=3157045 RepID=UPI0033BDA25B